jgi:hypothetical protein
MSWLVFSKQPNPDVRQLCYIARSSLVFVS